MGNCASSAATSDSDNKPYNSNENSECLDSVPSSKYQSPVLIALPLLDVFRNRQSNRRDMIVASEEIPQEEKDQILTVEAKRMRGRLSPFPEFDLTHYRDMTFHIPDDDDYFAETQDPRSLNDCVSSPKAKKAVLSDQITSPLGQLHPFLQQGFSDCGGDAPPFLPTFVKMNTSDEEPIGFGWTLASFSGGATEQDFSANEGLESSLKSSRLGKSSSKKKNVSFTAEHTTTIIQVTSE
ncbi:Hypothetical protein, putative [Bodo saltans]|uniref:Uncharacterized protein n=1 Tax=Bodo saltans TaxID=75058 RepID=A0A0S4IP67_BODSA|nr:Hypothetical protein, putative [Bodo saltans]|eukprot:CUE70063.1 Hypothetical protein, putative [Bodo saltans]